MPNPTNENSSNVILNNLEAQLRLDHEPLKKLYKIIESTQSLKIKTLHYEVSMRLSASTWHPARTIMF